jgi:pSer/pThr/pTyr-binding forkhead associated (FHA) protein
MIDDLGSMNGTRLNGWRVREWVPVRDGDLVTFGDITFVVGLG